MQPSTHFGSDETARLPVLAQWAAEGDPPAFSGPLLEQCARQIRETAHLVVHPADGRVGVAFGGRISSVAPSHSSYGWVTSLSPLYPEWLGDRSFQETHRTRFAYVAGEMANGIASTALVASMSKGGMLGFFGAAGLSLMRVEAAIDELNASIGSSPHGFNLIHSPNEPLVETKLVELFLSKRVRTVCASAFLGLTLPVLRFAFTGLSSDDAGRVRRLNHLFAKVSRPEIARQFMSPAPQALLNELVQRGELTAKEAELARHIPVASDVSVEADSGGHTDNQALGAIFPVMAKLRDDLTQKHGYSTAPRLGAGGGLGTPQAVASAFALGAAYVVTGSINQSSCEAGTSARAKALLCKAEMGDVTMAPSADMFEQGVSVQVLKRGTLFATRAKKLRELYLRCDGVDDLSGEERSQLERDVLGASLEKVWDETQSFWARRDPQQLARAERDSKHRFALMCRWYLGQSSRWAIVGDTSRQMDYQLWCGPAQASFNAWAKGSFLEAPEKRSAVQMALNLLEGAAVVTRAHQLRTAGAPMPPTSFSFTPRPLK